MELFQVFFLFNKRAKYAKFFGHDCISYTMNTQKGGINVARQRLYKKMSVLFYEKDKDLIDGLEKLSELTEDSMSKIVKRLIAEELKRIQTK